MTKNNLIAKGFVLFVEGIIAGAFIQAITEIVRNSIWEMKIIWLALYLLFVITDLVLYIKYGEEIIIWVLDWLGVDLD
jgi:hypothetical protein